MIKEIVKDREFLALPAEPATADDAQVAQDLMDTMASLSDSCACLAANQIGSRKAVIAYEDNGRVFTMYNPRLTAFMKPYKTVEGCLSLDGEDGQDAEEIEVKRFETITVAYESLRDGKLVARTRKFTGWTAEIIQHAIDHCAGKVV